MTISDYYEILGLTSGSSIDDVKRAYRKKARLYHPDINHSPEAKDHFINATEAYEFLIANFENLAHNEEAYNQAMEDWRKYRQNRSQQRANAYARASYAHFKETQFYKSTRIFDGATIIFSLSISVILLAYTIIGYIYRLKHPIPGLDNPSVLVFIMLLALGIIFFSFSIIYLKAFYQTKKRQNKN
jgi:curved DNA-binding protein CbpA